MTERGADPAETIRCLAARAPIYRAIAARGALFGGALALFVSLAMLHWQSGGDGRNVDAALFFVTWSVVCLCAAAAGGLFLWRDARRRGEPFASAGMRLAIRTLTPSLMTGAALSACLTLTTALPLLPTIFWLVFYGLALLSTAHFAPQGVLALGWAFLFTGVGAFFYLMYESIMPEFNLPTPTRYYPAALMGATFGVYHLVYAACAWPRRR